ncbi:cation:proton antiporter domain-containing protein, partial [Acidisphaera rubrifaciens]|uniref:cation:proton antiporter domain-containing protein n=1 Tax=Acidisphaera rubrifaciens TaxID=50715 RepID=UPI0006624C8A
LPRTGNAVPERVMALLEVESGLNDPMSVFLTFLLLRLLVSPESVTTLHAALSFTEEMGGGLAFGVAAGWLLALALRRLRLESALAMVFALAAALAVFGAAQVAGTSGFLATYVAGVLTAARAPALREALQTFFEGMAWLAQIVLFLMLGLLVTPHDLPPHIPGAVVGAAALIFLGRPIAVFACLLPFRYSLREMAFVAWVGLRGAVPIYLSFIPALVDPLRDSRLFAAIFIVVVVSLLVQGWTVGAAARLLGFGPRMRRA